MPHFIQHHCPKSVQIRSFFWSEYRNIRTRKNSAFGYFSRSAFFSVETSFCEKIKMGKSKMTAMRKFHLGLPVHRSFSKLYPFLINSFSNGKRNAGVICCRNIACSSIWGNIIKNPHQISQPFAAVTLMSEAVVRRCSSIIDIPFSQENTCVVVSF